MRYIEKVALSWADLHITTADEARTQKRNSPESLLRCTESLWSRRTMPAAGEAEFINKWTRTYGFSLELILEPADAP